MKWEYKKCSLRFCVNQDGSKERRASSTLLYISAFFFFDKISIYEYFKFEQLLIATEI